MPPLWNIPTRERLRASLVTPPRKIAPWAEAPRVPCVKMTPFEAPEVPAVKLIAAMSD